MNNIKKCKNCGANSFTDNICDYCDGERIEETVNQTNNEPPKKTVISTDMGKYDTIENSTLTGDMNTVKKAINCIIEGDMNTIFHAVDCEIVGDMNTVNKSNNVTVKGDMNKVK